MKMKSLKYIVAVTMLVPGLAYSQTGLYKIVNDWSDFCLDVPNGAANRSGESRVIMNPPNDSLSQKWILLNDENGNKTIQNANSGMFLTIPFSEKDYKDCDPVNMRNFSGQKNQTWNLKETSLNTFALINRESDHYLDMPIYEGGPTSGTKLQMYSNNQQDNQRWRLIKTSNR